MYVALEKREKMNLRERVLNAIKKYGESMTMGEIYALFPDTFKHTIRARVYENLGHGVKRIGRGLYISSDAIVEHGNSLEIIDRMIQEGDQFDFIFLDIPYEAPGQRSGGPNGNRNIFPLDMISPDEFEEYVQKLHMLLRTDESPVVFMFTSGRSSKKAYQDYTSRFANCGLKKCSHSGTYMKLWPNGNRMNMGKYKMPIEWIHFYSRSGKIDGLIDWTTAFADVPDRSYPTAKPYTMIKQLIQQGTKIGDWVLDPFGGSGKVLRACLELKRKCHIIDNGDDSFNNHLIPTLCQNHYTKFV